LRLPDWIRRERFYYTSETQKGLRRHRVYTVCEEARCPNRKACFSKPTATFLILGPQCTRNCGFCSVSTAEGPLSVDKDEPERVALAAKEMGLRHVVITSVTRDDLPDGGAFQFVKVIERLKYYMPNASIEVLVPDFNGNMDSVRAVLDSGPQVFNHNIETVPSLYPVVRPGASYERSLNILKRAKELRPSVLTKSGLMLGLGETIKEVIKVLRDLRAVACDMVTIGQYLRPTKGHLPVVEYILPDKFRLLEDIAKELGFRYVASGPLVRSSLNAEDIYKEIL